MTLPPAGALTGGAANLACSGVPGVIIEIAPEGYVRRRFRWFAVLPALAAAGACQPSCRGRPEPDTPYVAEVPEGAGAAVEILIDCSGSMGADWHGQKKSVAAQLALQETLQTTGEFRRLHPDRPVKVGVLAFSSDVQEILPIQEWNEEKVLSALYRLPGASGRTAIGDALDLARQQLYRSGLIRKYILVITDGVNTAGRRPEKVARSIAKRSGGAVSISVVAVDMEASSYAFIAELGGQVLQADNPASLHAAVQQIYEGKILAEAMDAEAGSPAPAPGPSGPDPRATRPTPSSGSEK
jgi:Mg-chelatase subunit ChlD